MIGAVLIASYGLTFYRTSAFQHELVVAQAVQQARLLNKQIILTRQWVADHDGLFLLMEPGVEANPYLKDPVMIDTAGHQYVKRNPAMVTRELSFYADQAGFCRYRVTTLKPINPANAPDDFERQSLLLFEEQGVPEIFEIQKTDSGHVLRHITPLPTEESCLGCHGHQGYKVGDIRGGLSVTIPMDRAYTLISKNNRMLLAIAIATIVLVGITLFLLIDFLVVRRLSLLAGAMDRLREEGESPGHLPAGHDEIGSLAERFRELLLRLSTSRLDLARSREQVCHNEKMAALGRLAAGVAHEINNPLGGMANCVQSMLTAPDDHERNRRYLELLSKGLRRIGDTVRQLLNFGRNEPVRRRVVDVDELIRECFALLEYGLKNVELRLTGGLSQPRGVDAEALKQVMVNLGLNGLQAMPDGGVLTVLTHEEKGRIGISISDTGTGIAPELLPRIFEPFFTTKEVGKGTGLGLSVTHALVMRMGGEISVTSRPGQGSTFTVSLPVNGEVIGDK